MGIVNYSGSGLNVWFRDDVKNTLSAIDAANAELFEAIDTPEMRLYRQGYQAALRAIAEAFGFRYEPLREARLERCIIDVMPY